MSIPPNSRSSKPTRPDSQYGARNHPLPNAIGLHAANHDETVTIGGQPIPEGERILMVRLGKPR